ncbi:MAG TPA: hemolysin family protein [Gemmatimonadales bacterium]|jgi:CBS domain containing-hemolysin-like protein|nr:hemolysin family protein [Gemmatimonadales bacterium]
MTAGLLLLTLALLVAAGAATVGVAAAVVSQAELGRWVHVRLRGTGGAAATTLVENPGRVLATANAITTLGVLAAGAAVPALFLELTPTFLGILTFAVVVPVFVVASYVVPRVLGRRWSEQIVARTLPAINWLSRVLAPFLPRRDPSTRHALAAMLTGAGSDALAGADELEVVSGVLAFADRPVRDVMTPRTSIVALPGGSAAGEAAHVFLESGYSRYPVLGNSLDDIVGVTYSKDLLWLDPSAPIPVRPILTVLSGRPAADLLLEMQRGGARLAVVVDEFGGTAGVVTFEDLLTRLMRDLFATEQQATHVEEAPLLELDGGAPVERLRERFGRPRDTGEAQTVGGFLTQILGRIPKTGERFTVQGLEIDVLAASTVRIERVVVRPGPVHVTGLDSRADGSPGSA